MKKQRYWKQKLLALILSLVLLLSLMPISAMAEETTELDINLDGIQWSAGAADEKCELWVPFGENADSIKWMAVSLYQYDNENGNWRFHDYALKADITDEDRNNGGYTFCFTPTEMWDTFVAGEYIVESVLVSANGEAVFDQGYQTYEVLDCDDDSGILRDEYVNADNLRVTFTEPEPEKDSLAEAVLINDEVVLFSSDEKVVLHYTAPVSQGCEFSVIRNNQDALSTVLSISNAGVEIPVNDTYDTEEDKWTCFFYAEKGKTYDLTLDVSPFWGYEDIASEGVGVLLHETGVQSISYTPAVSTMYEKKSSYGEYWDEEDSEGNILGKYFHYNVGNISDAKLEIKYANGKKALYDGMDVERTEDIYDFLDRIGYVESFEVKNDQSYSNPWKPGQHYYTVTYAGLNVQVPVYVQAVKSIHNVSVSGIKDMTYTGGALTQNITVTDGERTLKNKIDYKVSYIDNTKSGTATIIIKGINGYKDSLTKTFTIKKATQPLKVTKKDKSVKVGNVKKAKQVLAGAITVKGAKGTVTYKKLNKTSALSVDSKGRIIVKKGTKKGTYSIKVRVIAAAKGNYKKTQKDVTVKVKVMPKLSQPLKVMKKDKSVKLVNVKKAKQVLAGAITVKGAKGKVTYKKLSKSSVLSVDSRGRIIVKKGTKRGTYSIKVRVTSAATNNYKKAQKDVTVKVKVLSPEDIKATKVEIAIPDSLWAGDVGYGVMLLPIDSQVNIQSVSSSNQSVLKAKCEKTDYGKEWGVSPLKAGKSKITVKYSIGTSAYKISKTIQVKKYPNPFCSIKINGKAIDLSKNKFDYEEYNFQEDDAMIAIDMNSGWTITDVSYGSYPNSSQEVDKKKLVSKKGAKIRIPTGSGSYASISVTAENKNHESIYYIIGVNR